MTLVLACLLFGGWVRSHFYYDMHQFRLSQRTEVMINSFHKGTSFQYRWATEVVTPETGVTHPGRHFDWTSRRVKLRLPDQSEQIVLTVSTHPFHRIHDDGYEQRGFVRILWIPHMTFVILLTLSSCCLLLSKPCSSAKQKIIEPLHEKV